MNRKNLSRNRGAMLALKHMAKQGMSDREISKELYDSFGHLWSISTIARRRRVVGVIRKSPFKKIVTKKPTPLRPSPPKSKSIKSSIKTSQPMTARILERYFKGISSDRLPFEELCEYTASFFEPIANTSKGQPTDQQWWDTARDKVAHWNRTRERTAVNIEEMTPSQIRAYDYCAAMSTASQRRRNRNFREIYSLYREWRSCFIDSVAMSSTNSY